MAKKQTLAQRARRLQKKPKANTRFDAHCPTCGNDIGGHAEYDLEELFDGMTFTAGRPLVRKMVCPCCEEPIQVTMDVCFELKEIV